jgi:hypothetical protein
MNSRKTEGYFSVTAPQPAPILLLVIPLPLPFMFMLAGLQLAHHHQQQQETSLTAPWNGEIEIAMLVVPAVHYSVITPIVDDIKKASAA